MKKTIRKLYFNYEKEENWLNEMAVKGFALTEYTFGKYIFESCRPNEYLYRIELLKDLPSHPESQAYIAFLEETGVELVSSYFRWVYFRKKATDGPFDIYSDADSKIAYYKRIIRLYGFVALLNLFALISNLFIYFSDINRHPLHLYIFLPNMLLVILFSVLNVKYLCKVKGLKKGMRLRE